MAFDFAYDENLMNNIFFRTLQKDFGEVLRKAIAENCVICIPKTDSCSHSYLPTLEDFLFHILVPTEELPESHFTNLCGIKVKINRGIITANLESGHQKNIRVLFQETFYTEDGLKYEALCVERPINENVVASPQNPPIGITILRNFRDCLDLLWLESGTHETIECLDREVQEFVKKIDPLDTAALEIICNLMNSLHSRCMQIILKNPKIKNKYKVQNRSIHNLQMAVKIYLQQGTYTEIMRVVSSCTEADDSKLNKIIRNYSDVNFKEFSVNLKFHSGIAKARQELSKIALFNTTLGKLECLKRTIQLLSECDCKKVSLSADDLLKALSFLIVKTNLPNWNAQLKYLKLFYHSSHSIFDENAYLITSLEAAIAYVQNGDFCRSDNMNFNTDAGEDSWDYYCDPLPKLINGTESFKERDLHQFFHFVACGDLNAIKNLFEHEQNVNKLDSLNFCHPLCTCKKCSSIFEHACNSIPLINYRDNQGLTALHVASMHNVPNVVEYLLTRGADSNAADHDGRTPAHYAALKGQQNALLLLLHKNADINSLDNMSNTPLHLCSNNGHENCVKALVYFSEYTGARLNVNQKNAWGDTPLHHAAKWGYLNVVSVLLDSGSDPSVENKKKLTPLSVAHNARIAHLMRTKCQNANGHVDDQPEIRAFNLENGFEPEKSTNQACKGIQPGTAENMKKVEKVLRAVEKGDINLVCFYMGFELSDFVGQYEKFECDGRADGRSDDLKCHPLCNCDACIQSDMDTKTQSNGRAEGPTSKKKLNVNVCNADGCTPLHVAAAFGNLDLLRGFIKNGAYLNVQTADKLLTPLMLACKHQRTEIVKELLNSGANVDMQDNALNTALHYACNTGNAKLVEAVLKHEPDINLRNISNKTALQEAEDNVYIGIIRTLKKGPYLDLDAI